MPQDRTRKIVIAGVLGALSIFLGITRLGFIPWLSGTSITIMHIPVIIGAVLEGPVVGLGIGFIFGVFSLIQAALSTLPGDKLFVNPMISIFPRLLIGPLAYLAWTGLKRWPPVGLVAAGLVGSLTNTVFVLLMIGVFGYFPWPLIWATGVANGPIEAAASALLVLVIVAAVWQINIRRKKGSSI